MRKTVHTALLAALSLVSLSLSAPSAAPAAAVPAAATAPEAVSAAGATLAQAAPAAPAAPGAPAAPAAPAADTGRAGVQPPESAPKADSAAANAAAAPVPPAAPLPDSAAARSAVDTAAAAASTPAAAAPADRDSVPGSDAKPKKRKRVVRETTVNTIDELKGRYRSPKKALFMSLLIPGLGQAYVGQHWFNYARGAGYLMIDAGLLMGWNHYVNVKQDRQIRNYRRFADEHWSLSKYEDSISVRASEAGATERNPHRQSYCDAVQSDEGNTGSALHQACRLPGQAANQGNYNAFKNVHSDRGLDADSVGRMREEFPNPQSFYELIGKHVEFVNGWKDAEGIVTLDSTYILADGKPATTPLQQEYIAKRAKANDYARMQAWFLGGLVLNHIVSAVDAAFAANIHNKSLYQTEVGMLERLRFDSGLAWDGLYPRPSVNATLTF